MKTEPENEGISRKNSGNVKTKFGDLVNNSNHKVSRLLASAPSSPKLQTVKPEIQETIEKCARRSKTCLESHKVRCTITSERLAQLRKTVENAIKEHKIFSIKGGWPVVRRELIKRGWIEKQEHGNKQKYNSSDDVTSNLPAKQEWESPTNYVEKCERTVMSRMLANYDCDLYWSMRKEPSDLQHRGHAYKLINRFSRSLFASKEGLALLLQQSYWYSEDNVANINFPRCYVLGFPDHYNLFVDDFRMTASIGLLRWFTEEYEAKKDVHSMEGTVPHSAFNFAMDRCAEYIAEQRHQDIDKDFTRIWDHEWEQFLGYYYAVVHNNELFADYKDKLLSTYAQAKIRLKEITKHWPQLDLDGVRNIWIMKPGNKCRGRGIQLVKSIADVDKLMSLKLKYVVQKYIERPLIIYKTKFDIRQWFMVTHVQPLTIWMYKECYLRFSGQTFSLENFHESLHLTNHAVQCKYANGQQRDKALPNDNMWDSNTFKAYLKQIGYLDKWNQTIFPGMRQSIVCAMLASQDTMDRRPNTYEIYGADFMLTEDFTPWLLEINCSPDLSFSTSVTSRVCPQCMEDIIKVVVDRRKDPNADTGLFELVYKQNYPRTPPYLGMNLSVRGRKIFRSRPKFGKPEGKEQRDKSQAGSEKRRPPEFIRAEILSDAVASKALPKLLSPDIYKGPVIEDLIEELHKTSGKFKHAEDFYKGKMSKNLKITYEKNFLRHAVHLEFMKVTVGLISSCLSQKKNQSKPKLWSRKRLRFRADRKGKVSGNENTRSKNPHRTTHGNATHRRSYFGLLREWAVKNEDNSNASRDSWEKDTVSILKGENVLSKSDKPNINSMDVNKNFVKNVACLNLHTFDLNKLLPEINACRNNSI